VRIQFFNKLLVATIIVALSITTNVFAKKSSVAKGYRQKQVVYLADEPLPVIAKRLKLQGMSMKEVIEHLKKTLTRITPEIAKEKFDIEWIDNKLNAGHLTKAKKNGKIYKVPLRLKGYPDLVICYISPEVGYGLFAMTNIRKWDIVVEYTGKLIYGDYKANEYSMDAGSSANYRSIDAQKFGNAARFANHLISEDELHNYGYTTIEPDDQIATANLNIVSFDQYLFLVASRDIKSFEQIGFLYDGGADIPQVGYDLDPHLKEVVLFNKDGEVISQDAYQSSNVGIMLVDDSVRGGMGFGLFPLRRFHLEEDIKDRGGLVDISDNFKVGTLTVGMNNGGYELMRYLVRKEVWNEKLLLAQTKDRISVPIYILPDGIDYQDVDQLMYVLTRTISILQRIDGSVIDKEERIKLQRLAKVYKFDEADGLLDSLSGCLNDL
jgi:hypothetical protein